VFKSDRKPVEGAFPRDTAMRMNVHLVPTAVAIAIAATAIVPAPARAETVYPWCAVSSSGGLGQPLCHFATLEQCTAFLSGLNGSCRPNPRTGSEQPARRRAR
jgi:Protein of unknown function (DUF3551)